jgi:hypothetical protein
MHKEGLDNEIKGSLYFDRVEVGGSNPSTPTKAPGILSGIIIFFHETYAKLSMNFNMKLLLLFLATAKN